MPRKARAARRPRVRRRALNLPAVQGRTVSAEDKRQHWFVFRNVMAEMMRNKYKQKMSRTPVYDKYPYTLQPLMAGGVPWPAGAVPQRRVRKYPNLKFLKYEKKYFKWL